MNRTTQILLALLVAVSLDGAGEAYFHLHPSHDAGGWAVVSVVLSSALLFSWYYFDSNTRAFERSKWLNIAVIGIAALAIPYYVIRSRDKGQRVKAVLCLVGYGVLAFGADYAGGLLGGYLG